MAQRERETYYLAESFARTYYRIEHTKSDDTRMTVNPYPKFLRMIVGDVSRKEAWGKDETDRDNIRWTMTTENRKTTDYLNNGDWSYLDYATFNAYKRGQLEMLAKFPNCLTVKEKRTARSSPKLNLATFETTLPTPLATHGTMKGAGARRATRTPSRGWTSRCGTTFPSYAKRSVLTSSTTSQTGAVDG